MEKKDSIYFPREDSILLGKELEKLVEDMQEHPVLDMGTGSGFLSIIAAKKGCKVTAVDINPKALEVAKENAKDLDIEFKQSDLFSNINKKFYLIVFNPPYLPVKKGAEDIALDGGKKGREILDKFLEQCRNYLNAQGKILFIQSSITGIEETKQKLIELGFNFKITTEKQLFMEKLVVFTAW